jgi:hypothetical protein
MASHTYESVSGASDIDVRVEWAECPVNASTYHAFRQREAASIPCWRQLPEALATAMAVRSRGYPAELYRQSAQADRGF